MSLTVQGSVAAANAGHESRAGERSHVRTRRTELGARACGAGLRARACCAGLRARACGAGWLLRMGSRQGERGSAVVEFSWLALLLMVPLVYVMLGVFDVQRASYGATTATRAAGRAFIIVPAGLSEDEARARAFEAARLAMKDQGLELSSDQLTISCSPACLEPGSTVTVTLNTEVPLPLIPDALGGEPPAIHISASHTEPYGDYREAKGS